MALIFINYRRSDSGPYAGRFADYFRETFDFEVFLDNDSIEEGEQFPDEIRANVSRCDVFLALIGREWINAASHDGNRRLHRPGDYVRREIRLAFQLGRSVIPVLIDGATMPANADLPDDVQRLATCEAYTFNGQYFERDAADLGRNIELRLAKVAGRAAGTAAVAAGMESLLMKLWLALLVLTISLQVAPAFWPLMPALLWVGPMALMVPAFCFWLYFFTLSRGVIRLRVR